MHWYQRMYLVNIPEPVQYQIYAMAFLFDLRCESVTYVDATMAFMKTICKHQKNVTTILK